MLGYLLNRLLVLLLAYAYPAYECFKSIEKNKPDIEQMRFWCQYWYRIYRYHLYYDARIIIAAMTVWDPFGDSFIGWFPMYSEVKLVICVYLWYPKTQGTKYIYNSFLKPYLSKHEPEIDRTLSQLKTRAGDSASLYFQRVVAYGQTRVVEIVQLVMAQSMQRPQPATETQTASAGNAKKTGASTAK